MSAVGPCGAVCRECGALLRATYGWTDLRIACFDHELDEHSDRIGQIVYTDWAWFEDFIAPAALEGER